MLLLSIKKNHKIFKASEVAEELKAPKEFVAKVLQILTDSGIVGSKKGKNGGFYLAKKPSDIKIIDIIKAIDGLDVFKNCVLGFPGCSTDEPCPLHEKWGALRDQAYKMFAEESLEQLKEKTLTKILSL